MDIDAGVFLASLSAAFAVATMVMWRYQKRAMEREAAQWKAELKAQNDALRMARRR